MRLSPTAAAEYTSAPFDLDNRSPIVAYIDGLGYLRCPACASRYEGYNGDQEAQDAGNGAMWEQVCDICHASIDEIIAAAWIASHWDGMGLPPKIWPVGRAELSDLRQATRSL